MAQRTPIDTPSETADTFPKLLLEHARQRGNQPAMREKDYGIWQEWSWRRLADEVHALANGLAASGFQRDDRLAIIGDNRPQLYGAMAAAQSLGGVAVPMYQDAVAAEMVYVLNNAEIRFAMVEDQEQVDKLLEIKDQCPQLELIIYDDPRGMRHYHQSYLHSLHTIQQKGHAFAHEHSGYLEDQIARGRGTDIAAMSYTSGTTGNPKGVVLTFDNLIKTAANAIQFEGLTGNEETLAYLPMAWIGDNIFSYAQHYVAGFCVNCPESSDTVLTDLREIAPTYFFAPPRIWESLLTTVMIRIEDA
ncbi:MAG: AMP-binding protein, partial [Candidatus Competibacteraceae bacterium]|nr:AMP-binding protein [Candidatus Competibacteraceae bacterium]